MSKSEATRDESTMWRHLYATDRMILVGQLRGKAIAVKERV